MSVATTVQTSGEVVPFDYGDHNVRVIEIDGEPWFVATDVCRVLGIRNVSTVVGALDDDERCAIGTTDTPNGRRVEISAVSESGLCGGRATEPKAEKK